MKTKSGTSGPSVSISALMGPNRSRSASWPKRSRSGRAECLGICARSRGRCMPPLEGLESSRSGTPEGVERVAGVVLAAGSSSRMGHNKLLLELGGETVVHRAARNAIEAGLDPVVVVLGHEAERVQAELF